VGGGWKRQAAACIVVAAALIAFAGLAHAATRGPAGPVQVAAGHLGDLSWQVGVESRKGRRCYLIGTLRTEFDGGSEVCSEGGIEGDWQRVTGDAGDDSDAAIELDLTSTRVHTLRLITHRLGSGRGTRRRTFHPRMLTPAQSAVSGMPRDFRFVVIVEPTEFCVEGVEARDFAGRVLEHERIPCES
jgi:hypothetical protein